MTCVLPSGPLGANVNAAKLHETALHHAAKVKNVDLIEMLIEFGGNIYARDNRGKKPSDYTWSSSAPAKCFEYYESELGLQIFSVSATRHLHPSARPPGLLVPPQFPTIALCLVLGYCLCPLRCSFEHFVHR